MIVTYCATALKYGSSWIKDETLDYLTIDKYKSKFGGHDVEFKFYKEGDDLMVKWRTKLLIPEDVYYIDMEMSAEMDVEGLVVNISEIKQVNICPHHADVGAKKIKRFY